MRILVPVDGSVQSRHIVRFLGSHESLLGTHPEIELVNVQYGPSEGLSRVFGKVAVDQAFREEGEKIFEQLRPDVLEAGVKAEEKVLIGEIGPSLAEEAKAYGADLIVMGSRGLNPIKGFFLGSFTNATLSAVKTPVMLLRAKTEVRSSGNRVGIAIDGSEYGAAAVDYVLKNAKFFGPDASFTLIHVTEPYNQLAQLSLGLSDDGASLNDPDAIRVAAEKHFEEAVETVRQAFGKQGLPVHEVHLTGHPADELARYANENLDLMVMGSHGRGNFTAAVLGSVTSRVIANTELPVLVVKAH